jgi:copper homeostasis protein (lipoprotein)
VFKLFIAALTGLSVIILISCNQSSKNRHTNTVGVIDSTLSDGHNSSNALDVEGVYLGTLPCADCEGIETTIRLNADKSYFKQTKYLGKDGRVFEEKGFYTWNREGNTITLTGIKNGPNQYFVGENTLNQLDMAGKKITGNLASKYILNK